jgi:hypothetical protein
MSGLSPASSSYRTLPRTMLWRRHSWVEPGPLACVFGEKMTAFPDAVKMRK